MGQVALGQLQGQYEAQQMQQRDQQQAFQQGLQLFGTRHGLEQEQRQERLGAIREAGSHARDIIPEQRGGFLSDIDTRTAAELDRPYQTGLSQFDDLIRWGRASRPPLARKPYRRFLPRREASPPPCLAPQPAEVPFYREATRSPRRT
jgi:hypothetical protein